MALIKCPECGKNISTEAEVCPNCGYPLKKKISKAKEIPLKKDPEPINPTWIEIWFSRANRLKAIWSIVFAVSVVLLVSLIILMNTDKEAVNRGYDVITYEIKTMYLVLLFPVIFNLIIAFSFWLTCLCNVKVQMREFDGYTVLVYSGFVHCLVIEGKVHASAVMNRYMYGTLPNGKKVMGAISFWGDSIKIELE